MTEEVLRQSLEQARQGLVEAVRNRDHWNLEILRLQQVVNALAISSHNAEMQQRANTEWQVYIELTQAIEALVNASPDPISPIQVRDALTFYGYNIARYSNPMSMIHQTLKRLVADGRIRALYGRLYTRTAMYDALLNA